MARTTLRFLPRKATLTRAVTVVGIVAAATALTATNAFADEICARFTTSQYDWTQGKQWGSYPVSSAPGPNDVILKFQTDGNLVLYRARDNAVMWASGWNPNVKILDWSASAGGILLEDSNHNVLCTITGTSSASGGWAQVQSDGDFVFYNPSGQATWATFWGWGYYHDYCDF